MQSLILGTAQWGLDYGVTNTVGRLSDDAVAEIATVAWDSRIRMVDTAPAYGDAEERIGRLGRPFAVQTKMAFRGRGARQAKSMLMQSLERLRQPSVHSVLVHDWSELDAGERRAAARVLEDLREEGMAAAVGVSGYDADDVTSALNSFTQLDVVQVPVSILDQRLVGCSAVRDLRRSGGRVQARSMFLQGAALAGPDHVLVGGHPDVIRLRGLGDQVALCIGFIRSQDWIDEAVVAPTSVGQLQEILDAFGADPPVVDWGSLASADDWLVDPRQWTRPTQEG